MARVANKLVPPLCFFCVDVINVIYMSFLERSVSSFVGSFKIDYLIIVVFINLSYFLQMISGPIRPSKLAGPCRV